MNDIHPTLNHACGVPLTEQIVSHFEGLILSGRLADNTRLPSGQALAVEWGCGYDTVQRAMNLLAAKGIVRRAPQRGTFVNASGACRSIGVLFGQSLTGTSSSFVRTILSGIEHKIGVTAGFSSAACNSSPGDGKRWSVRAYDKLNAGNDDPHSGIHHLLADMKYNDFAGFIGLSLYFNNENLLKKILEKPLVAMGFGSYGCVQFDFAGFTASSVRALAGLGARKILYFRTAAESPNAFIDCNGIFDAASECGLPLPEIVQLHPNSASPGHPLEEEADSAMMAKIDKMDATTGLVISDDFAARGIAMALLRSGLGSGKAPHVLAWQNEGIEHYYGMPIHRCIFSMDAVVDRLLTALWQSISGKPEPAKATIQGRISLAQTQSNNS